MNRCISHSVTFHTYIYVIRCYDICNAVLEVMEVAFNNSLLL